MSNMKEVKELLIKSKKTFDVALMSGNDEAVVNNYILGICNTLATTPTLLKCTKESIRDAAITSATLGIAIDARQWQCVTARRSSVMTRWRTRSSIEATA